MIKKRYNLQKELILKHTYKQTFLNNLLIKSLGCNHYLSPLNRISYLCEDNNKNFYYRFSTYQKLMCLITLSPKVNSKKFHYSRFFLNKQLNKLVISNTFK